MEQFTKKGPDKRRALEWSVKNTAATERHVGGEVVTACSNWALLRHAWGDEGLWRIMTCGQTVYRGCLENLWLASPLVSISRLEARECLYIASVGWKTESACTLHQWAGRKRVLVHLISGLEARECLHMSSVAWRSESACSCHQWAGGQSGAKLISGGGYNWGVHDFFILID